MPIFDLFSKRRRREHTSPDVFAYDLLPEPLRVQIIHILDDSLGTATYPSSATGGAYSAICDILRREYGVFKLNNARGPLNEVQDFILNESSIDRTLDAVELSFRMVDNAVREQPYGFGALPISPDDAIEELNGRFKEHCVGYAYESGAIIRVDSTLLHAEVIRPALKFLTESHLAGANEEFLKAHAHYRAGRLKECIAECLKAFESTMKAICDRRKWRYGSNDTAKSLIDVLFKEKLIPDYLQSEFGALRTILESGIPTTRNRTSGHGQGSSPVNVPDYFAGYVLHMTASTVLFLAGADRNPK